MHRDPIRYQSDAEPHPLAECPNCRNWTAGTHCDACGERLGGFQWRPLLARALALSCFLSLGVATVGAALLPLSLVPQLSFAAAIVLMLGACWAAEGADHA